jgi:hypothetical protein
LRFCRCFPVSTFFSFFLHSSAVCKIYDCVMGLWASRPVEAQVSRPFLVWCAVWVVSMECTLLCCASASSRQEAPKAAGHAAPSLEAISDAPSFSAARRMPRARGKRASADHAPARPHTRARAAAQIHSGEFRTPRGLKRAAPSEPDLPAPRSKKPRLDTEEKNDANLPQVDRCIIDLVLRTPSPSDLTSSSPNTPLVGSRRRTRSRKDIGSISSAASVFSKRSIVNEYVCCTDFFISLSLENFTRYHRRLRGGRSRISSPPFHIFGSQCF